MVIALKSNLRGGEFKTGRGKVKLGGVLDMVLVLPLFPSLYYLFVCFFFPFHLFSLILFFSPSFFFPFTLCHSFLFSLCFFPFSHYISSDVFGINSETFRKPLDFTPGRVGPTNA